MYDKLAELRARRENGEGGFTLIELLVVVVIIGILVAIAIPLYLNYQKNADEKSVKSDIRNAVTAIQECYADNANTMPASATFDATHSAFAEAKCANDTVHVSSDSTATLEYVLSGTSYTVKGTGTDSSIVFTFDSSTGNIS